MAITHSYVDPVAGSDALGDGSIGNPWKTLQWAFDHLVRNVADGNQVNLRATGPHVNAAALDLTTFIAGGALASAAPLILRGYTAAANDGGVGEIDCNGATMWASNTYDYMVFADLEMHTFGDNDGVYLDQYITLYRCEVHKGVSAPNVKRLVRVGAGARVAGCHIHDTGTAGTGVYFSSSGHVIGSYFASCLNGVYSSGTNNAITGNVVLADTAGAIGLNMAGAGAICTHNVIYNTAAGTGIGINLSGATGTALNNILCGFSGVGGDGISITNGAALGYNAFWNNTANNTVGGQTFIDLTANDIALAADPFTDAANGDFSLTAAGKAALRGLGWPGAYLGAHANTDGHITIGPIQYGEAATGYPAVADVESGVVYGESNEYTGTFTEPGVGNVESGVTYGGGGVEFTGTFDVPAEADVRLGTGYGAGGVEFTGTLAAGGGGLLMANKRGNKQV